MAVISLPKFRHYGKIVACAGLLAFGSLIVASTAVASSFSSADVFTFQNPDGTPIPAEERDIVGSAVLVRSEQGITVSVHTSGLKRGNTYTNWWVIFNNPDACDADGCNASDFGNPEVEASVLHATGRVAYTGDKVAFNAFLPVGLVPLNRTREGRERIRFGPGLQNTWKAEIHYVIKCHGPAGPSAATLVEQISTFNGGCGDDPPGFACFDAQAIVFPLPKD